jgi:zinc and cadmium transporter
MSLIGDSIHNFIDGLIIAATFLVDIKLGITTAIAIGFHEIPQEIGDFAVLLYAGVKKGRALALNFLVALTIVIGGIAGYFLALRAENLITYFLPLAAGGFLYVSTSDLIPEIRKEKDIKKSLISFTVFFLGLGIMYLATLIE